MAQQFEIHTTQINTWKREFLSGAKEVFDSDKKPKKTASEQEREIDQHYLDHREKGALRTKLKPDLQTGHLHVPLTQYGRSFPDSRGNIVTIDINPKIEELIDKRNNHKNIIMKFILLISAVLFNANLVLSQPISTPGINIKSIISKNKPLCFITTNGIDYTLSIKKKCKSCKKSYNYDNAIISVNKTHRFIYKKDTMRLKLSFDSHSPFRFQIDSLLFQKGNFNIDLKGCKEILKSDSFPILINKLPNDCMPYLKEEEEQ